MLQELHAILFTPSVLRLPFYSPSMIGFCAMSGILFLLLLLLRGIVPPLRPLIPPASRKTIVVMVLSSGVLALAILLWGSPSERLALDVLWEAGYWLFIIAWIHLAVSLSHRASSNTRYK